MKNINKVFFYFKKIKDSCDDEIESIAKNLKLTKPEVDILIFLVNNKENRGCDICDFRGFSKSYVSKAVNKLLKRGYITIKQDEKDKRYQHIIINAKAKKTIKIINNNQKEIINRMFKGISEEELNNFKLVINKISQNLERK
ncbi:MAG: MarR family winged helix-turn-helix transcriptional regulator [Bacilli bacterium]